MQQSVTWIALALLLPSLAAQEPKRPDAATKFRAMIGHWEGNGITRTPGTGETVKWSAHATVRAILDGRWVQEEMRIDMGSGAPAPLVFRSYYGFDKQTGRWTQFSFSNMGVAQAHVLHWLDGAIHYGVTTEEDGKLCMERWRTTFKKDSFQVLGYRALGNEQPGLYVRGAFSRSKADPAKMRKAAAQSFLPPAAEMTFIQKWSGTYRLEATMTEAPGKEPLKIAATDRILPLFGGVGSLSELNGDPIPGMGSYKGRGVIMWSAQEKCYRSLWIDSMGEVAFDKGYRHNGKLIFGGRSIASGVPTSYHNVIEVDGQGALSRVTEHRVQGDGKPFESFAGRYVSARK